jgi:VanZ family protein
MVFIYSASTDALSSHRTSRIIGPLLRWLYPGVTDETIYRVQYAVRKTGHLTEYAILACLLWRARRQPARGDTRPWNWREAGFALGVAALYAISDEVHQAFVPSREPRTADVLLDTAGAAAGLFALWQFGRWRKQW